jgi:NAD-dependent SIR2 family protein deacetylase
MTVLYGRSLPPEFFEHMQEDFPDHVDLFVVAGTSLTVGPANSLVNCVSRREREGSYFLGKERVSSLYCE